MRHANISIFVPHFGCPNRCSFCNQFYITSHDQTPTSDDVRKSVGIALGSLNEAAKQAEIAFFGGSFTAVDREYMESLLSAAYEFVAAGKIGGIRISTRPDEIDAQRLDILKKYGVTAIELGAQSMKDRVLAMNDRGHTASDVICASKLIKSYGFSLGLQMMTGLYGDNDAGAEHTAREFIKLRPDTVRIYPTIVLKDTKLAHLYEAGIYIPERVEDAVSLCSRLMIQFEREGIEVIRVGLHTISQDSYIAGPWHPAFGELCQNGIYRMLVEDRLNKPGAYDVYVRKNNLSKAIGHKRNNALYFENKGIKINFLPDESLKQHEIKVEEATDDVTENH